jgi:hypothetical protein
VNQWIQEKPESGQWCACRESNLASSGLLYCSPFRSPVQSQSQSYFTTGGLPPICSSWRQAPWDSRPVILFSNWTLAVIYPYVSWSLTRGWVCHLQLMLVLASAVILRSESIGTHDHILLSQIRHSPSLEGQVPVFISPRKRMARLYSQALGPHSQGRPSTENIANTPLSFVVEACLPRCYIATAFVSLFVSTSLLSNGSVHHHMYH